MQLCFSSGDNEDLGTAGRDYEEDGEHECSNRDQQNAEKWEK